MLPILQLCVLLSEALVLVPQQECALACSTARVSKCYKLLMPLRHFRDQQERKCHHLFRGQAVVSQGGQGVVRVEPDGLTWLAYLGDSRHSFSEFNCKQTVQCFQPETGMVARTPDISGMSFWITSPDKSL